MTSAGHGPTPRATIAGQSLPPWVEERLACPLCSAPLRSEGASLLCSGCAQRYPCTPHLDLVPPGKRPPNEGPGDTDEMARRRATWERRRAADSAEHAALTQYLDAILPFTHPEAVVLDLGCGTGAVLQALGARFEGPLGLLGFDISRPMLDLCYRTLRSERRAVVARASTRRPLPLADASVTVVLRRLAPALPAEIRRVLVPEGAYITFSFGPDHWHEIYDLLPNLPRPRQDAIAPQALLEAQGFVVERCETRRLPDAVTPGHVLDRLLMGPAAFHIDRVRDLPALHALAERQGTPGRVLLTAETVVCVARLSRLAR